MLLLSPDCTFASVGMWCDRPVLVWLSAPEGERLGGLRHGSRMHVRLWGTQLVTASEGKALVNGMRTEGVRAQQTEVTLLQPTPSLPIC